MLINVYMGTACRCGRDAPAAGGDIPGVNLHEMVALHGFLAGDKPEGNRRRNVLNCPHWTLALIGDLWHMYEAYRTAFHMFGGRAGQPWADERPGGHILDNEADRCIHAMDQIFDEARRRDISPTDNDADHMASLWALRVVDDGGDIGRAAVFLAACVK